MDTLPEANSENRIISAAPLQETPDTYLRIIRDSLTQVLPPESPTMDRPWRGAGGPGGWRIHY